MKADEILRFKQLLAARQNTENAGFTYLPQVLEVPEDASIITSYLEDPNVNVHDNLYNQLEELLKSRHVREKLSADALKSRIHEHLGDCPIENYGVWVYYPWNKNLVHLLPKEGFIEVRTSRNQYKITREEQELLMQKKIGIIGLSVGQSVSLTMAMERCFGEIRLADFDELELTNLNRIRTGVHNLALPKVYAVAREIMEIDPFLKVVPFDKGLTKDNMEVFFMEGGKLDLLIDECDGLDIKILARYKARELQIPVLMEASDRATVDVERFDLEPNRPLLHGLVNDLDPERLAQLKTNEDKVPYMLAIVGLDTISTRAKASMVEIGETISTWPQLASAVTLGGGITADVARRIFLDQYRSSGRYHIDLDELIGDRPSNFDVPEASFPEPGEIEEAWIRLAQQEAKRDCFISADKVERVLNAAHSAPSGGNLQPWAWLHHGSSFFLFRKKHLTSSFLDHNLMATWVSLGASIENLLLALQKEGFHAESKFFPGEEDTWVARFDSSPIEQLSAYESNNAKLALYDHIHERHTNRNIEVSEAIDPAALDFIRESLAPFDLSIRFFKNGEEKDLLANCIAAVERIRLLNPEGYQNFMEEIRWTPEQARKTGDGVDLATADLTPSEVAGFRIARHRPVLDLISQWELGTGLEKLSFKGTDHAPILAMIHGPKRGRDAYLEAGRALERAWIAVNQQGLAFQPQSPFTLLIDRIMEHKGLNERENQELFHHRENILRLTSANHPEPLFIFRLFKGKKSVVRSYRRNPSFHIKSIGD